MVGSSAEPCKSENAADNGMCSEEQKPGAGAPIFHGIRVVELSTILAGPMAAVAMAYLGADVIKVEDKHGDPGRQILLQLDQVPEKREFGCVFELANINKKSVQMDLRKGIQPLLLLLADADVFVTNIRRGSLKRLKLDYESLCNMMPHLVYAHASAFGRSGPMADHPGYDVGAFWAISGLAEKMSPSGCYGVYPTALGDNLLASSIFGGIAAGLYQRMQTGKGCLVDGSLLRMGAWCLMPYLNNASHSPSELPTFSTNNTLPWEDMNYCSYHTKEWDATGDEIIVLALGTTKVEAALNVKTINDARQKFHDMTLGEAEELLCKHNIPFMRKQKMDHMTHYDTRCAEAFSSIPGASDLAYLPIPPYHFSCSSEHRVVSRAPRLGQHTDSFTWAPRPASALLPKKAEATPDMSPTCPLQGVTAVELSSVHTACMASGAILRQLGARVVSIVTGDGLQYWLERNAAYATQLQEGKEVVTLDIDSKEGQDQLQELLRGAQVFLTNYSKTHLEKCGFGDGAVRATHPSMIYCRIDTWLHEDFGDSEGTLGAWYAANVAPQIYRNKANAFPFLSMQMGDLCAAQYASGACMSAIFHRARTGEGQLCGTNLQHLGIWCAAIPTAVLQKNPQHLAVYAGFSNEENVKCLLVPLTNAFKTKDGVWVMTLGLELHRHLPRYFAAFGIKWLCIRRLLWTALFEVLPRIFDSSIVAKVMPLARSLHLTIREAIGSVTFAEFHDLSEKYDLWYVPINTVESFLNMPQARLHDHVAPIEQSTEGWRVRHPVFVTANTGPKMDDDVGGEGSLPVTTESS
eukprot:GEMP01003748.1.p1 GENE.GEMP01003748.1~~GEMP01003748.1.p1  ORF type:complete len:805 (+),score=164.60 GEMP01003748.1:161-2575(+)